VNVGRAQVIVMFKTEDNDRGQVGIGTLIVFIAMVLVAAIAAGVLINTAGFLQSKSEETGQQSGEQVTNRLQVLSTSGVRTPNDGITEVGGIEMISTKAPGAEDIDLTGITMQWIDDSGTYDVVHHLDYESSTHDGGFGNVSIKDDDNSLNEGTPVINNPDDRVRIVVDVGAQDSDTGDLSDAFSDGTDYTIRDSGLPEGASAQIRITTASGAASTVRLTVPESLSGKTAVSL
jgi:flagellin FlaB